MLSLSFIVNDCFPIVSSWLWLCYRYRVLSVSWLGIKSSPVSFIVMTLWRVDGFSTGPPEETHLLPICRKTFESSSFSNRWTNADRQRCWNSNGKCARFASVTENTWSLKLITHEYLRTSARATFATKHMRTTTLAVVFIWFWVAFHILAGVPLGNPISPDLILLWHDGPQHVVKQSL